MGNEKAFADVEHGAAHVVHPHDQLGRRFHFPRDLGQYIAWFDDVFFFFRRGRAREEDTDVQFAQQILGFVCVRTGRIFLDVSGESGARFRNFSVLSQLGRGLIFRQRQINARFRRDFSALFFGDLNVFLENVVVSEPGGPAENDDCEKEDEQPLHGLESAGDNFVVAGADFQPRHLEKFQVAFSSPGKNRCQSRPMVGSSSLLQV